MAVIAAFELHDLVSAGIAAGESNRAHGGLGAGINHAHQVNGRDQFADLLGHFGFDRCRCSVTDALIDLGMERILDDLVAVAKDHGPPGTDVIDVAAIVFVVQVGAVGVLEKQRGTTDSPEGPDWRVDASRDVFLSLFE